MLQQAIDFRDESDALFQLLEPIAEEDYQRETQFYGWTINDVLGHLHLFNWVADLCLNDPPAFEKFAKYVIDEHIAGKTMGDLEKEWLKGLKNRELLQEWRRLYYDVSTRFESADPKKRVKWFGPDMSVRSCITARLMETWAHGLTVFDILGVARE